MSTPLSAISLSDQSSDDDEVVGLLGTKSPSQTFDDDDDAGSDVEVGYYVKGKDSQADKEYSQRSKSSKALCSSPPQGQ